MKLRVKSHWSRQLLFAPSADSLGPALPPWTARSSPTGRTGQPSSPKRNLKRVKTQKCVASCPCSDFGAPAKKLGGSLLTAQAFTNASFRRAEKDARRNVEKDQTRLHVPAIDRTFNGSAGQGGKNFEGDVPPVIVAVMGPQGVRYTTGCHITALELTRRLGNRLANRHSSAVWSGDTPKTLCQTSRDQLLSCRVSAGSA